MKNEFFHKIWDATSGCVNTFEAVERHAKEWIKQEDKKFKKRQKVQQWREIQTKEKEERMKKTEEIRENCQECKDCERKVKSVEKEKEIKQRLAEWKEIKAMKEELANADNMVRTVAQFESDILQSKAKKLVKRPKSARNLLRPASGTTADNCKSAIDGKIQRKMIEAFQRRDEEDLARKMEQKRLEKAKTDPNMRIQRIIIDDKSTLMEPTESSIRKGQPYDDPLKKYDRTFELETRLLQIDSVPKLGLPDWRVSLR